MNGAQQLPIPERDPVREARDAFVVAFRALEAKRGLPRAALSITACCVTRAGTVTITCFVDERCCLPGPASSAADVADDVFNTIHGEKP